MGSVCGKEKPQEGQNLAQVKQPEKPEKATDELEPVCQPPHSPSLCASSGMASESVAKVVKKLDDLRRGWSRGHQEELLEQCADKALTPEEKRDIVATLTAASKDRNWGALHPRR